MAAIGDLLVGMTLGLVSVVKTYLITTLYKLLIHITVDRTVVHVYVTRQNTSVIKVGVIIRVWMGQW